MRITPVIAVALFVLSTSCGSGLKQADSGSSKQNLQASNKDLHGYAFELAPMAFATATVAPLRPPAIGDSASSAANLTTTVQADDNGHFSFSNVAFDPPYVVTAKSTNDEHSYRAYIEKSSDAAINVTPHTTLVAGLADYLARSNKLSFAAAMTKAETHLSKHFVIHRPSDVTPILLDHSVQPFPHAFGKADVQMSLSLHALGRIATDYTTTEAQLLSSAVSPTTLTSLIKTLVQDLQADGKIDGLAGEHNSLHIGSQPYTDDILHLQYAKALRDVAAEFFGKTNSYSRSACNLAATIADSESEFFPNHSRHGQFRCDTALIEVGGTVYPIEDSNGWLVRIYTADQMGHKGRFLATSDMEPDGHWSATIEDPHQAIFVEAIAPNGAGSPFSLLSVQPSKNDMHLHPFVSLMTAYAQRLVSDGHPFHLAVSAAQAFVRDTYGQFASGGTKPKKTDLCSRIQSGTKLYPDEKLALLIEALSGLSRDNHNEATGDTYPLYLLTNLLTEDLGANGKFKGRSASGSELSTGAYLVTKSTLREDLARGLRVQLFRAQRQAKGVEPIESNMVQDMRAWADHIKAARHALFDGPPNYTDDVEPTLQYCEIRDQDGRLRDPLITNRGPLRVSCRFAAANGIARIGLTKSSPLAQLARPDADDRATSRPQASNGAETNQSEQSIQTFSRLVIEDTDTFKFQIVPTKPAQRGPTGILSLYFEVTDLLGTTATKQFDIAIDNTPPTLDCQQCDGVQTGTYNQRLWASPTGDFSTLLAIRGAFDGELVASGINTYALEEIAAPELPLPPPQPTSDQAASDEPGPTLPTANDDEGFVRAEQEKFFRFSGNLGEGRGEKLVKFCTCDGHGNCQEHRLYVTTSGDGPAWADLPLRLIANDSAFPDNFVSAVYPNFAVPADAEVLRHFANRLDDTTPDLRRNDGDQLPVIYAHLEPVAKNAQLQSVAYQAARCQKSDCLTLADDEISEWRDAPRINDTTYFVPISYQTMLPSTVLGRPDLAKDAAKWLQRSFDGKSPASYLVRFRATDRTGKSSFRQIKLVIFTALPPATYTRMAGLNLRGEDRYARLNDAHTPGSIVEEHHFDWPILLSEDGLFTPEPLNVTVRPAKPLKTVSDKRSLLITNQAKPYDARNARTHEEQRRIIACEEETHRRAHNHDKKTGLIWILQSHTGSHSDVCGYADRWYMEHTDRFPWSRLNLPPMDPLTLWQTIVADARFDVLPNQPSIHYSRVAEQMREQRDAIVGSFRAAGDPQSGTWQTPPRWIVGEKIMLFFYDHHRVWHTFLDVAERVKTSFAMRVEFDRSRPADLPVNFLELEGVRHYEQYAEAIEANY